MRSLLNLGRAVGALVTAFLVMIAAGGFALLNAATGSGGSSGPPPSSLTYDDVHRSARLTATERKNAVNRCVKKGNLFVATSTTSSSRNSRRALTDREHLGYVVERGCDCIVNQFEDRSSKMQFMMAMTVIDNGFSSLLFRTRPDFSGYWPAAQKHGMTRQDFQSAIRDLELIARSSIKTCDLHLTGR